MATTDINQMTANAAKYVASPHPTQANVAQLNDYITELNNGLSKIAQEKQKLIGEVGSVNRTKEARDLANKGDEYVKALIGAQNELAQTHSNLQAEMALLAQSIDKERQVLSSNQTAFDNYTKTVKNKLELLATRDRMLQLSQERNVYKKKVIYILFAIIIALTVAIISAYTFFGKKA